MDAVHVIAAHDFADALDNQIFGLRPCRVERKTGLSARCRVLDRIGEKLCIVRCCLEAYGRFIIAREAVGIEPCLKLQILAWASSIMICKGS